MEYVGQEQLQLSSAPVLSGNDLSPRHLVIRNFLTATDQGYAFMPGGLTRIAASADTLVVSMQKGGGSKDTWVLSDAPVDRFTLLPTAEKPVEVRRDGGDLPSRSADDLYWLGRHIERVEGKVRLARGLLIRLTEQASPVEVPELPSLLQALTGRSELPPRPPERTRRRRLGAVAREISSIVFDDHRVGSLRRRSADSTGSPPRSAIACRRTCGGSSAGSTSTRSPGNWVWRVAASRAAADGPRPRRPTAARRDPRDPGPGSHRAWRPSAGSSPRA